MGGNTRTSPHCVLVNFACLAMCVLLWVSAFIVILLSHGYSDSAATTTLWLVGAVAIVLGGGCGNRARLGAVNDLHACMRG